ncbi:putative glyceraldehyde-3-phosphate dehydrogenase [Lipomyces kononenkoae]
MSSSYVDATVNATAIAKLIPPCKVGINGFGRIGRSVLRASLLRGDVLVNAINHTCESVDDVVHLINHDSTHGPLQKLAATARVEALSGGDISVNGRKIALFTERNPDNINWAAYGVEYVAECTGKFKTVAQASKHVSSGKAKRVLISAPSADASTFVYKVNTERYADIRETETVFSCASCTTNCLGPVCKVIDDNFGIVHGFMTTVHASTQSQHVLDGYSRKDRRSGRSVIGNVIPTSTGASKAVKVVLPSLAGKISGISVRVPVANVSMLDLNVQTDHATTLEAIIESFSRSAETTLSGVVTVENEELVSSDFLGNPYSAIVDAKASAQLNPHFFKIIAWYDNEWSYSCRLLDVLVMMYQVDYVIERESYANSALNSVQSSATANSPVLSVPHAPVAAQ